MRKEIMIGLMMVLLLVSLITGVYAHGQVNSEEEHDEWDYMDEMYEECELHHRVNINQFRGHMTDMT